MRVTFKWLLLLSSALALLLAPSVASLIIEHSGSADPTTEGSSPDSGNSSAVPSDIGGIPAWHSVGGLDSTQMNFHFPSADIRNLSGDWPITANLGNRSADSGSQTGLWVTYMPNNVRFDIGLHRDGNGDQVLRANGFQSRGPTYTFQGLGANYALPQVADTSSSHTADYDGNGASGISGYAEGSSYFYPGLFFGADNGSFSLLKLETGGLLTTAAPEPSSAVLIGLGGLALAGFRRWRRISTHR
jgi:hypothetical protein